MRLRSGSDSSPIGKGLSFRGILLPDKSFTWLLFRYAAGTAIIRRRPVYRLADSLGTNANSPARRQAAEKFGPTISPRPQADGRR